MAKNRYSGNTEHLQSVINKWLDRNPYIVDRANFSFSGLSQLDLSGLTRPKETRPLVASTPKENYGIKQEMYNAFQKLKEPKTGETFSFSSLTQNFSANTTTTSNELKTKIQINRLTGNTSSFRVKKEPLSKSSGVKSTPKKLASTGFSFPAPSTIFTAGTVDFSFPNGDGYGFDVSGIFDIKIQPDGKILVGGDSGYSYYYDGDSWTFNGLIRLNADGTVDETFDITYNWDCYGGAFDNSVYAITIQPDGKILVGGAFTAFDRDGNCNTANHIIRLNSDGSRDYTFNTGNGFDDYIYSIVLQPDGKILCCGDFNDYNGTTAYGIIRLNSNGSVDSSFNIGDDTKSFNDSTIDKIILLPDNKILVCGGFSLYSGVSYNRLIKLLPNGEIDSTFNIGNGFDGEVIDIAIQSDGKIIAGGAFTTFDNNDLFGGYIVRLNSDGSLDTYFGYGLNSAAVSITIQPNDKILVGGFFDEFYPNQYDTLLVNGLVRFNADCSFDYSFYFQEQFSNSQVYVTTLQNDGKILVGGYFDTNGDPITYPLNYFGRLNNSITTYPFVYLAHINFCSSPNVDLLKQYVTIGSNEPLIMGDWVEYFIYSFRSLKNPLQVEVGLAIGGGGGFGNPYPTNLIEYEYDKSYDYSNNNGCSLALDDNAYVAIGVDVFNGLPGPLSILVNKNYKIGDIAFVDYVIPGFDVYLHSTFRITDLLPGGTNTPTLYYATILPYRPYKNIEESVQINGQYIGIADCNAPCGQFALNKQYDLCQIGKQISFYNCTNCGVVDYILSFFDDGSFSYPYALMSAGTPTINSTKVWESCHECAINQTPEGFIDYFNFYYGDYDSADSISDIVELSDGKILNGGYFGGFDGNGVGYLVKLNSDGTLDTTFNVGGSGFDYIVKIIVPLPNGKILVGGGFENYNGVYTPYFVKLNKDGSIDNNFVNYEFNGYVRAITVQSDGKILVGGDFDYYGEYFSPYLIRLNSDGSVDETFNIGNGFDDSVYGITIETTESYDHNYGLKTITETLIVTGEFSSYDGYLRGGIVRISSEGSIMNTFDNGFTDFRRVYGVKRQPDGKLLIWGNFSEYNYDYVPYCIVRLNSDYTIDTSFVGVTSDDGGGFNATPSYQTGVISLQLLPNGKMFVALHDYDNGTFFDINGEHYDLGWLVKLNSDGTLDTSFTYVLDDDWVNKVKLLNNGELAVGGWFNNPEDLFLKLYIGEEYTLRQFNTCDGETKNIYLPSSFNNQTNTSYTPISVDGLDLIFDGQEDDDYFVVDFPIGFSVDFLGVNYTSVNVSTNPYITFGDPGDGDPSYCCFDIPQDIPTTVSLPGVFISFQCPEFFDYPDYDSDLYQLYTGLTDNGNTFVIKWIGKDHCDAVVNLVYGFKFFKNDTTGFELVIEENTSFFDGNPTGGVSDGVNPYWVSTFNSGSQKVHRIGAPINKTIKGDINKSNVICGKVGDVIYTPQGSGGIGGSMYFDGNTGTMVVINAGDWGFLGGNDFTIEWFQYFEGGSNARPFSIGVYNDPNEMIGMSFEGTVYLWINNSSYDTNITNDDLLNGWHHIAITRNYEAGPDDRFWRVFLDGVLYYSAYNNSDTNNNYELTIGNQLNDDGRFQGYITNFRVNNTSALYTDDFSVPTQPLDTPFNTILLMLCSTQDSLLGDFSEGDQTINATNVTWSDNDPFPGFPQYFISSNTDKTYTDCDECLATVTYKVTILNCFTNEFRTVTMSISSITNIETLGPIFADGGSECYVIFAYEYGVGDNVMTPTQFFGTCNECMQPLIANSQYRPSNLYFTDQPELPYNLPMPAYTSLRGKLVYQANAVELGGFNGLNN